LNWNEDALDGIQNPTGLIAGTYSVTVTDAIGCSASAQVSLSDPAALVINCVQQSPTTTVGGSNGTAGIQIGGGTPGYTISWNGPAIGQQSQPVSGIASVTGLRAGTYSVTVTDARGCSAICSFVIDAPVCNISLSLSGTNPRCAGERTGSITAQINNASGPFNWNWNIDSLDGVRNPVDLSAGNYAVTVTDAIGCMANASVTLSNPEPVRFSAYGVGATCLDGIFGAIRIEDITGGNGPFKITIQNNSIQANNLPIEFEGLQAGLYQVIVENAAGCRGDSLISVPNPRVYTLDLGPDIRLQLGDSVLLEGFANFPIAAVRWLPDTAISNPNSAITYARPLNNTTYRLIAFDSLGCSAESTIRIFIDKNTSIFVPNVFSPNGDNINDLLYVFADNGVKMVQSFRIFDRWGNLVFERLSFPPNDPQYGWDGYFNVTLMNPSVFIVTMEVEYLDGRRETLKGEVTLMR